MYNFLRTIRTAMTSKSGALTATGVVLALTMLLAGCPRSLLLDEDLVPPSAGPANLAVEIGNNEAVLTWDAVRGATEYRIYRADSPTGALVRVTTATPVTDTTFVDSGVTNDTAYRYVVRAVNSNGESPDSTEISATPMAIAPPAPANPTATAGDGEVTLSWAVAAGADEYQVYRADTPNGALTRIDENTTITETTYTDTTVTNGTAYRYTIRAINNIGESPESTEVSATPASVQTAPLAPANPVATAGDGEVTLMWDTVTGASEYYVFRADTPGGALTRIAEDTTITETTYTDTTVTNGTAYRYTVRAVNDTGESPDSTEVSATPAQAQTAPLAPASLTATAANAQITLVWDAVTGASEYYIYRADTPDGALARIDESTTITDRTYTDTGLTNDTPYRYTVRAVNAAGVSPDSDEVSATPTAPIAEPAAPTNLTATAGDQSISLSWGVTAGATEYYIFRADTPDGALTRIDESTTITAFTYTDTGLTNGTAYRYTVRAVNSAGQSPDSTEVSATPAPVQTPPLAPANPVATAGDGQVTLTWATVTGAAEYYIYRADTPDGALTRIAEDTTITETTYTDTTVTNGTAYRYTIRAVNSAGQSPDSTEVSATPASGQTAPLAPANPVATAGDGQVTLMWDTVTGATEYRIYRADTPGGTRTRINENTMITAVTYTDIELRNGTEYRYTIRAFNASGESPDSTEVSATPAQAQAPLAPANPVATAGDGQVTLMWDTVTGATEYRIYRADTPGGTLTRINENTMITAVTYTDSTVTNGTAYRYTIRAFNAGGESPDSTEVSATPVPPPPAPLAPANPDATAGDGQVTLMWDTVTGATEYRIYRADTPGGTRTRIDENTTITATTYTDSTVTNGTAYRYTIRAVSPGGESPDSTEVSATPVPPPPAPLAPANPTATAGNGQVTLMWDTVTGATEYRIYRADTPGGTRTRIDENTMITAVTYTDSTVTNGTAYRYTIRAFNAGGESPDSTEVSATPALPAPLAPANPMATAGNGQVTLMWDTVTGAAEYRIYRANTPGGALTRIDENNTITAVTYTDMGLANGIEYRYTIRAVNAGGESPDSTEVSATPVLPAPLAPANLVATAANGQVTLVWDRVAGATGYRIFRAEGVAGTLANIPGNAIAAATTYINTGLTNGTLYRYTVRAVNAAGVSPDSDEVSATPIAPIAAPAAPELSVTAGDTLVSVSWDAVPGATQYYVYRGLSAGTGTRIDSMTTITGLTHTSTGLTNGTTYYYTVRAVNIVNSNINESPDSTEVSVVPVDHGDTITAATPVTSGVEIYGTIATAGLNGDFDYFSIEVTGASESAPVTINAATASIRTRQNSNDGALLNSSGTQIGSDERLNNTAIRIIRQLTENGTYYIRLGGSTLADPYTLTVTVAPTVIDTDAHRNILSGATPVTSGTAVAPTPALDVIGDFDYFSIEVTGASSLTPVSLLAETTGGTDTFGILFDSNGIELALDDDGGAGGNFRIMHSITENGTYYIRAGGFSNNRSGPYSLTVTTTP